VEEHRHRHCDLHAAVLAERGHAPVERVHAALELRDARLQAVHGDPPRRVPRVLRPPPQRHHFPVRQHPHARHCNLVADFMHKNAFNNESLLMLIKVKSR
jgi:hypothetical protein